MRSPTSIADGDSPTRLSPKGFARSAAACAASSALRPAARARPLATEDIRRIVERIDRSSILGVRDAALTLLGFASNTGPLTRLFTWKPGAVELLHQPLTSTVSLPKIGDQVIEIDQLAPRVVAVEGERAIFVANSDARVSGAGEFPCRIHTDVGQGEGMRVALMVTCVNDAMFPDTGRAVVSLLRRLGVEVEFPEMQTCCAQPMVNTGYVDEAVPVVGNFVSAFAGYDAVVTPSGSCAGSARHQHGIVARRSGDPALVAAVADLSPRVYELSEFLVDVVGVTDVGAYFPHAVAYHPTCHSLRMLGVGERPRRLLEAVRGLRLVDLPKAEECCGFGGTFAIKNADTSVAMGTDKAGHVRASGAEVLVAGDNSCLMHVGGVLSRQQAGVRVMHLAEVLASTEPGGSHPTDAAELDS